MTVHCPKEREEQRREFQTMLEEAEAEADRDGMVSVDSVLAEMDEIIDQSSWPGRPKAESRPSTSVDEARKDVDGRTSTAMTDVDLIHRKPL